MKRASFSGLLSKLAPDILFAPDQWEQIKSDVHVEDASSLAVPVGPNGEVPPKKDDDTVRIACISDTHTAHRLLDPMLPIADILVHCGDYSNIGRPGEVEDFCDWLDTIAKTGKYKKIVCINGIHEVSIDTTTNNSSDGKTPYFKTAWRRFGLSAEPDATALLGRLKRSCILLEDESVTFEDLGGIKIFGTPCTPEFYDWGWNRTRQAPPASEVADPALLDKLMKTTILHRIVDLATTSCAWHEAITEYGVKIFRHLFEYRLRTPDADSYCSSLFFLAIRRGFLWLVRNLDCFWAQHGDRLVKAREVTRLSAMHIAATTFSSLSNVEVMTWLLEHDQFKRQAMSTDTAQRTPLALLASQRKNTLPQNAQMLALLLVRAAPEALFLVSQFNTRPLEAALLAQNVDVVRAILKFSPPDVRQRLVHNGDMRTISTLHAAVAADCVEGIRMIVDFAGKEKITLDWNVRDAGGNTPLLAAAMAPTKALCVEYLLTEVKPESIDVTATNACDLNALDVAPILNERLADILEKRILANN